MPKPQKLERGQILKIEFNFQDLTPSVIVGFLLYLSWGETHLIEVEKEGW
jgi:hypothetical protein